MGIDTSKTTTTMTTTTPGVTKSIQWKEDDHNNDTDSRSDNNPNPPPPMRKIKFSSLPSSLPPHDNTTTIRRSNTTAIVTPPQVTNNNNDDVDSDKNVCDGGSDHPSESSSSDSSSSSCSSERGTVAFSGWARVFFQARHHPSATLLTPFDNMTPWSQDTYLYLSIIHYDKNTQYNNNNNKEHDQELLSGGKRNNNNNNNNTNSRGKRNTNELHICAASITNAKDCPPTGLKLLIDPPIALKYFYALKVPGSNSGAALFLRNDTRKKLRKYIFRFEFVNTTVHHNSPNKYIHFLKSGRVAKKSMARYRGMGSRVLNKLSTTVLRSSSSGGGIGGSSSRNCGRGETGLSIDATTMINNSVKHEKEAYEAHLSALDELLRESSEAADRFVDIVNDLNAKEEEEERYWREMMKKSGNGNNTLPSSTKRPSKPLPPYWGSGFNLKEKADHGDEEEEYDSDYSEEDEEDDNLNYDDENDDETLFDRVQISTGHALESIFNHIVK